MTKRNPSDTVGTLVEVPPDQIVDAQAAWDRAFEHFEANADWYAQVKAAKKRFTKAIHAGLEDV